MDLGAEFFVVYRLAIHAVHSLGSLLYETIEQIE